MAFKMYREANFGAIAEPSLLNDFVTDALAEKRELFWFSLDKKKPKHSQKIVGSDLERRIFDTARDALVLFYHPLAHKNRGVKQKYEEFAKTTSADPRQLLVARCNGINESEVYRPPAKLPALVYFKTQPDGSFKEIIEYELTRDHMLRSSTGCQFSKAMEDFIKEN